MKKNCALIRIAAALLTMLMLTLQLTGATGLAEGLSVQLPASVKAVEEEAFAGDASIEEVIVPEGAETIGSRAFADNDGLKRIVIPESVTAIAEDALEGSESAAIVCEGDGTVAQYAIDHGIPAIYTSMPEMTVEGGVSALYAPVLRYLDFPLIFHVENYRGGTGTVEIAVTAKLGLPDGEGGIPDPGYTGVKTYSFEIKPKVEPGLPSDITISQNRYAVPVGGTLGLEFADIRFTDDGQVPEGAYVSREYYTDAQSVDRETDDAGARFTFNDSGRYIIYACAYFNGLRYAQEIAVTVGDPEDAVQEFQGTDKLYIFNRSFFNPDGFVAMMRFDDCAVGQQDILNWQARAVYEGESASTVSPNSFDYWLDITEDGRCANFIIDNPRQAGTIVFEISLNLNDGEFVCTREFAVDIELLTSKDIACGLADMQTVYSISAGDTIAFRYTDIQPDVPEEQRGDYDNWTRMYRNADDGIEFVEEDEKGIVCRFNPSQTPPSALRRTRTSIRA